MVYGTVAENCVAISAAASDSTFVVSIAASVTAVSSSVPSCPTSCPTASVGVPLVGEFPLPPPPPAACSSSESRRTRRFGAGGRIRLEAFAWLAILIVLADTQCPTQDGLPGTAGCVVPATREADKQQAALTVPGYHYHSYHSEASSCGDLR